jgi:hypothetical protein
MGDIGAMTAPQAASLARHPGFNFRFHRRFANAQLHLARADLAFDACCPARGGATTESKDAKVSAPCPDNRDSRQELFEACKRQTGRVI